MLQHVSLPVARAVFLLLKLAAVAGLVLVWRRTFRASFRSPSVLVLTLVLGYDQAFLRDVWSGNLSTFEQFFLWLGLGWLVHGHIFLASIGIAASAYFKQATGLFLVLTLLPFRPGFRGLGASALGGLLLVVPQLLAAALDPELYREFWGRGATLWERDTTNPSTLVVAWRAAELLSLPAGWGTGMYVMVALAALGGFAGLVIRRGLARDPLLLVSTTAFAYALAMPRMKDYSYILLLLPSLHVAGRVFPRGPARAACYGALWIQVVPYQPWLAAAMIYVVLVVRTWSGGIEPTMETTERPEPAEEHFSPSLR